MKNQIIDPVFGLLQVDRDYDRAYEGEINFLPDEQISIYLNFDELPDDSGEISDEVAAATLSEAHGVYADFKEQEPTLRRSIASRAYDGDWTPPEGKTRETFTFDEFLSCMKLNRIVFHGFEIFSVVYDYGDLFDGFMADDSINADFTLRHT